jgi:hypothetical protein
VGHEILDSKLPVLMVSIGIERCEQCCAPLHSHADVQRAAQPPVFNPAVELAQAQVFLSFGDRVAANA